MKYSGADWLKSAKKVEPSPLGERVADLLGQMFLGICHLERDLDDVDWTNPHYITIKLRFAHLATFDNDTLTRLVILCHDRALRCEIEGRGPQTLQLMFHQRQRDGQMYERHPTMEQAIAAHREHLAID